MKEKKLSQKIDNLLKALLFFTGGVAFTLTLQSFKLKTQASFNSSGKEEKTTTEFSSPKPIFTSSPSPSSLGETKKAPSKPKGKYTIVETEQIRADRTQAETGEEINFYATLENQGTKKKFLTHICFNYNDGNFGCILNKNLFPGEKFSFHNGMIFPRPGAYSVWITWSQDSTNFYYPINGGKAKVEIE